MPSVPKRAQRKRRRPHGAAGGCRPGSKTRRRRPRTRHQHRQIDMHHQGHAEEVATEESSLSPGVRDSTSSTERTRRSHQRGHAEQQRAGCKRRRDQPPRSGGSVPVDAPARLRASAARGTGQRMQRVHPRPSKTSTTAAQRRDATLAVTLKRSTRPMRQQRYCECATQIEPLCPCVFSGNPLTRPSSREGRRSSSRTPACPPAELLCGESQSVSLDDDAAFVPDEIDHDDLPGRGCQAPRRGCS